MSNTMKVITKQDRANTTAKRWKKSYYSVFMGKWHTAILGDSEAVYDKLLDLGDNPSPEDINSIIGNESWTRLKCDHCNTDVDKVVSFPALASDEYGNTDLCKRCIIEMYDLITLGAKYSNEEEG